LKQQIQGALEDGRDHLVIADLLAGEVEFHARDYTRVNASPPRHKVHDSNSHYGCHRSARRRRCEPL
jgi:hypothetical protein